MVSWVAMSKSIAIVLLLACFLLLTIIGLTQAQESPVTLATDKTVYNPGDTVTVTVTSNAPTCCTDLYVEIISVPSPVCSYSCPTVAGSVSFDLQAIGTVDVETSH